LSEEENIVDYALNVTNEIKHNAFQWEFWGYHFLWLQ
jgi:hypothetical protein